jgi:hypothetical protein
LFPFDGEVVQRHVDAPKAAAPEWISVGVSWGLFVVLAVATIALAVRHVRRGKTT